MKLIKVCISPGHSRTSSGTFGNGLDERIVVWDPKDPGHGLTQRFGHLLRELGHETVFTREWSLVPVSPKGRARIANKHNCDLLVSWHCNGVKSDQPRGVEIFYAKGDEESKKFAEIVEWNLKELRHRSYNTKKLPAVKIAFRTPCVRDDTQGQHDSLSELRNARMPAILIEAGFLSNEVDAGLLESRQFRQDFAAAVVAGCVQFMNLKRVKG